MEGWDLGALGDALSEELRKMQELHDKGLIAATGDRLEDDDDIAWWRVVRSITNCCDEDKHDAIFLSLPAREIEPGGFLLIIAANDHLQRSMGGALDVEAAKALVNALGEAISLMEKGIKPV